MEIINIIKDVVGGNLPPTEYLGFAGFLLRKAAWFIILAAGGLVFWLISS